MRKIAFLLAAASLFAFAPLANRFGVVASSVALVWLGVLLALFASGAIQSLTVATGALGAFGSGILAPLSPAAAGAVLVAAAFAERTTRIRSKTARAVHVLAALVGGALAGSLSAGFATATLPVFVVAVVVGSVLAALPLLVEADDPVAHALDQAAAIVGEPAKKSLSDGAEIRRTTQEVPLDRATQERVRKTWQSLLKLSEARIRLERSRPTTMIRVATQGAGETPMSTADQVLGMLDQRIAEHVTVLGRAYTAVDTANAATLGLDDTALKTVEPVADSLEEVSRAMVEVKASAS